MLFFLLPLLFLLPGTLGSHENKEDFRFCADRIQIEKGFVHYRVQKDTISIVNSAEGLNITAPFPPERPNGMLLESGTWPLPELLGSYRFCIYWFQDASLFMLRYGGSKNYSLSTQATYPLYSPNITGIYNRTGGRLLHNVSYAFDKGFQNISLFNASTYKFFFTDSGKVNPNDMEEEFRHTAEMLKKLERGIKDAPKGRTLKRGNPFGPLLRLESKLGQMAFQEPNKTLQEGELLQASVWTIPPRSSEPFSIKSQLEAKEVSGYEVILPKFIFENPRSKHKGGKMKVVHLAATSRILFQVQNSSQILGGKVIGVSVGNTLVHHLPQEQRVRITFWHSALPRQLAPQCVFWDKDSTASQHGHWNTSGCEAIPGETQTVCLCDHLTFFAVLMVSSPEVDQIHQEYLTLLTYIGCIISASASFITIFFFLCSRKKQRDHIVYVHMNLLWAIFLLDMSFLIAVPLAPTGGDTACKAGAMFLHFGVLACLTWMGIEGYSLYQLVVEVFSPYIKHFLLRLCLIGWGLPLFIVSLIFVIDGSHYGPFSLKVYDSSGGMTDATICWITRTEINNFLNLGFLSLVLFFNSLMLAVMVREILRLKHREHHWEYAVMLLGLSCVLGIPWGLAFFSFAAGTFKLVAVYLFTILNSFQGFLIFLWYLAKVLQSRRSSSMQCSTSNSIKLQSNSTSI
uniref:Adhesion G-protein coupled receptor G1 n=1 Tax=Pogona vitticeps TaxID=103695 RepID=A0ABM5EUT0_9SAUR